MTLIHVRCFNHADREAALRCPECGRFYCRECGTEHDRRFVCAACLRRLSSPRAAARGRFAAAGRVLLAGGGIFLAWLCFYLCGQLLLAIPAEYHEGTVWERAVND